MLESPFSLKIVPVVAQSPADAAVGLLKSIALPLLGLTFAVLAGWFAISWVRRWMRPPESGDSGFTLDELRKLHRSGEISDEEYARAREAIIGSVRARPKEAPRRPEDGRSPQAEDPSRPAQAARPVRPPGLDRPKDG